jgi:Type VI secretion system, TssO
MQPINKEERRKAFGSFLVLFLVTMVLVALMVFFSVQVPFKENEQLRSKMEQVAKDRIQAEQFVARMNEAIGLLSEVDKSDVQSELVDTKIEKKVGEMYNMVGADSSINKTLFANVVTVMFDLQAAKKRLRATSGTDQTLATLRQDYDKCQSQLLQLQANNNYLQLQLQQQK